MRYTVLLLLVIFCTHNLLAQQNNITSVKGVVIDEKDKEPVANVLFYLQDNEHLGGITDAEGAFSFDYPHSLSDDSLVISSLGYQQQAFSFSELTKTKDTLYIIMKRLPIMLDDVVINAKGYNLKEMVQKALDYLPKNYPDKTHLLQGFYRKVSTEKDQYTHLVEAAIKVQDYSYNSDLKNKASISVDQFRQSHELAVIDSVMLKYQNKLAQKFNRNILSIYHAYESATLRLFYKSQTVFNKDGGFQGTSDAPTTYELMDISIEGNDTIYQIGFAGMNNPAGASYLKINSSDWAIVEYQRGFCFQEDCVFQEQVKFEKKEGKYYPSFIKIVTPRVEAKNFEDHALNIETYWFDTVQTKNFKKIKHKDTQDRMQGVQALSCPYNSVFWNDRDIQHHPLNPAIQSSLEREKSLEKQFKESAYD